MDRLRRRVPAILAALAYAPMLLTRPGWVSADTKSYLTLDPGRLLSRAVSMWDPSVGAGTVTHQNIGYLFPLGPYYWVMDRVGVPDWITQRALWGTLVFAAALGVWRLLRWRGWAPGAAFVAAVAYGWSPYLFSYLARLSVILGPWAAMPWLIWFAARASRRGGWRDPACFALTVALVGSSNATSLLLALLGPVLWVLVDLLDRQVVRRAVLAATVRIAVLVGGVSLWWIAGLRVQGTAGIPILRYTETYETVARASTPAELLRGLGYWFFYGGDKLDQWVGPSKPYLTNPALMILGFTLAGASLLGLFVAGADRRRAAALVLVGLAVSAGAAPWPGGSWYGAAFRAFAGTTSGMAMRSTPRAVPLVALGAAIGLARGAAWAGSWLAARRGRPALRRALTAVVLGALAAQAWPWFTLQALTPSLLRRETLPGYERDLAAWLDTHGAGRVWELPGSDFANYRWGGTVDPVLPGLIDRPYLARELVPQGGAGTMNLLNALDRRLAEGWFEPAALPAVARLFGVDTVVARNDLEYERYRLARPAPLDVDLRQALGDPQFQGPLVADSPRIPMYDPTWYGRPDAPTSFPAVAAYAVPGTAGLVSARPARSAVVLVGDGEGLVDAAAAGLLDGSRPVLYAASDPQRATTAAGGPGSWLILTDSNRKQGQRWSGVGSNEGALEMAGVAPVADDRDQRLDVFPGLADGARTVLAAGGQLAVVTASGYGNRFSYTPEDAAAFAVDGDPLTAWRGAVFDDARGLHLDVTLTAPVTADHLTVVQPQRGVVDRFITRARLTLTDTATAASRHVDVDLGPASRQVTGQRIDLPAGSAFDRVRFEVLADNLGPLSSYAGEPGVGLAELSIPGVTMSTTVAMPLPASVAGSTPARLSVVMTRQRIDPGTPNRFDPEPRLSRRFQLGSARTMTLGGQARLAPSADDSQAAALAGGGPIRATADRRMDGAPQLGAQAAVDDDRATVWTTPLGAPDGSGGAVGAVLRVTTPTPQAGSTWTLRLASGPAYSTITALSIQLADGSWTTLPVPPADPLVTLPAGVGSSFAVRIDAIRPTLTAEYFTGARQSLPAGIVDLVPASGAGRRSGGSLGQCRDDLVTLDGRPLRVRLTGTAADALARRALGVESCGPAVQLSAGPHRLEAVAGTHSGIDLDRLVFDSGATPVATPAATTATVHLGAQSATSLDGTLDAPTDTWLVLGESWNPGWTASVGGRDLGAPVLIDGYANGWLVPAGTSGAIHLRWTPQRSVTVSLWISLVAVLLTTALAILARNRPPGPWIWNGPVMSGRWWTVTVVVVAGVVGGLGGLAGALVAVAVPHLARRGAPPRWSAPLAVVVAGALSAGWIVISQFGHDYPAGAAWPDHFRVVTPLVWFAVAVACVSALLGGESPSGPPAPGAPQPPSPS